MRDIQYLEYSSVNVIGNIVKWWEVGEVTGRWRLTTTQIGHDGERDQILEMEVIKRQKRVPKFWHGFWCGTELVDDTKWYSEDELRIPIVTFTETFTYNCGDINPEVVERRSEATTRETIRHPSAPPISE